MRMLDRMIIFDQECLKHRPLFLNYPYNQTISSPLSTSQQTHHYTPFYISFSSLLKHICSKVYNFIIELFLYF